MTDNLRTKWLASFLRRWHSNADLNHTVDPICGHSGRVAIIVDHLWPNCRKDLLRACIMHDIPEALVAGDMCGEFKSNNPGFATMVELAENQKAVDLGIFCEITMGEKEMLRFADRLDAYLWMKHHKPHLSERKDWIDAQTRLVDMAKQLGVLDQVDIDA